MMRAILLLAVLQFANAASAANLEWLRIADDGKSFVAEPSGRKFTPWGVNYDRDHKGRLLEDYWLTEWPTVEQDFQEIKQLGANVVRIHLQFGRFMNSPTEPNEASLTHLEKLIQLADQTGLYLDLTGLACYHKKDVPAWLDPLNEQQRWAAQAVFWKAIAKRCADQPAVFFYDLLNEPAAPKPGERQTEWLFGEFFGKYYGQRIALETAGRSRQDIVVSWIDQMVAAIRVHDRRHLVTVGMLPPEFDSGFLPAQVASHVDFLAVHIYPTAGKSVESLEIVKSHSAAKLLIIEEIYPLRASCEQTMQFINDAGASASGWISFYWGETPDELSSSSQPGKQIQLQWLRLFTARGKMLNAPP